MEIWKDVPGYEGLYQVSNIGNVRIVNYRNTGFCRMRKLAKNRYGYLQVLLVKNGERKLLSVHRLVAMCFVDGYREDLTVNHINEVKDDNRAENLEWCTQRENNIRGTRIERAASKLKKPVMQIDKNGTVVKIWDGASDTEVAGFYHSAIAGCCKGKNKTHKGYKWQYAT